jgi:hypothetical protein
MCFPEIDSLWDSYAGKSSAQLGFLAQTITQETGLHSGSRMADDLLQNIHAVRPERKRYWNNVQNSNLSWLITRPERRAG